jgi:hypothetical protein
MAAAAEVSVVIPVGTGSPYAAEVVAAVLRTSPGPAQVVVVNDRVADGSLAALPADARVQVVRNDGPPGPSAARNAGARAARCPYLLFLDADVFVRPDICARLARAFAAGADAVVGIEAEVAAPNLASRYKNLWMRYTYLKLPRRIELFYTSCAAVRRDLYVAVGGMDEGYRSPSVEDTAFGRTLAARGARIVLEKEIAVEHRKTYTPGRLLVTAFRRGAAMGRCILRLARRGVEGNWTSVPTTFVISLPFAALAPLWWAAAPWSVAVAAAGCAGSLAAVYVLNLGWLSYLASREPRLLFWALPYLPVELAAGFAGGGWGTLSYLFLRRRY